MDNVQAKFSDYLHHSYSAQNVNELADAPYTLNLNSIPGLMQNIDEELLEDSNLHSSSRQFNPKDVRKMKSNNALNEEMMISAKRKSIPLSISDKTPSDITPGKRSPRTISKRVADIAASRVKEAMSRVY